MYPWGPPWTLGILKYNRNGREEKEAGRTVSKILGTLLKMSTRLRRPHMHVEAYMKMNKKAQDEDDAPGAPEGNENPNPR